MMLHTGVFYRVRDVFFFNDTATTEIYTLSLHDALPIWRHRGEPVAPFVVAVLPATQIFVGLDRKSTRLNSSHYSISYAVFCLKKHIQESHDSQRRKIRGPRHSQHTRADSR